MFSIDGVFSSSLLGGQSIIIEGSGFGTDKNNVIVSMGSQNCTVESIADTQIVCVTSSTAQTHKITNNA